MHLISHHGDLCENSEQDSTCQSHLFVFQVHRVAEEVVVADGVEVVEVVAALVTEVVVDLVIEVEVAEEEVSLLD